MKTVLACRSDEAGSGDGCPRPPSLKVFPRGAVLAVLALLAIPQPGYPAAAYYPAKLMPPPTGMYQATGGWSAVYANGVVLRNVAQRGATQSVPPPPTREGAAVTNTFTCLWEMDVSTDYGSTFSPVAAVADTSFRLVFSELSAGLEIYDAETLDLNVHVLPSLLIRESPTLVSSGQTTIRPMSGGFQIDSFFDIYTEVSIDSGMTWSPASCAARLKLKPDPTLIPATTSPRAVAPLPNGHYASGGEVCQAYANGYALRRVSHRLFTGWMELPPVGGSYDLTVDSHLDYQLSTDGGLTWLTNRAPSTVRTTMGNVRDFAGQRSYDAETTQFDVSGGGLPPSIHIRESPTLPSLGGATSAAAGGGGGGYDVSSFFDIFTEITTDGGQTWSPATNGPARLVLDRIAPSSEFASNLQPPPNSQYRSKRPCFSAYASAFNVVFSNLTLRAFSDSFQPPAPGQFTNHFFNAFVEAKVSLDGGLTFHESSGSGLLSVSTYGFMGGDGVTEYYRNEMVQLNVALGVTLYTVMLRESPTRASLGMTTATSLAGGGYQIDSFFDIFTEISLDGGGSWSPTEISAGTVVLGTDPPLTIIPPENISLMAADWNGRVVTFPSPATTGGVPPVSVGCLPPSGSLFPIGVTPVACEARDAVGHATSCWFNVEVVKVTEIDEFPHSVARLTLQGPTGGSESLSLAGASRMEVYIGPWGEATDIDGDGREDVAVELTDYTLRGYSAMLGKPVTVSRAAGARTAGKHEEIANNTLGKLDVPPFTPTGACDSFFDIFTEITIGGQVLHPSASFLIQRLIHYKPPAPGERYVTSEQLSIPLLDEAGKPSGITLTAFSFVPATTVETDLYSPIDTYLVMRLPSGRPDALRLTGTAKVRLYFEGAEGAATDNDSDGLEEVIQELCDLSLSGLSSAGPVSIQLAGAPISLGQIEERVNNNAGVLDVPPFAASGDCDSFFDVFYLWSIGGEPFHNVAPWRLSGVVTHKPSVPGNLLANTTEAPLDFVDQAGDTTLVQAVKQWLALKPPDLNITSAPPSQVRVSWPNPSASYRLESCEKLAAAPLWQEVTNTPAVGGDGRLFVDHDRVRTNLFFRLYRPLP